MPSRGVLYMTWNEGGPLERSLASLSQVHPDLPVEIARLPGGSSLLDKATMNDRSPFDTTLFLDADTVVLGDLTYGFEQCEKHDVACSICECPWANRYPSISGDVVEYNTGVIFWQKNQKTNQLFDAWKRHAAEIDSSIEFRRENGEPDTMPENDQAGFAMAMHELGINPFVLPINWNFRKLWHKSWFGPIKIWHDYSAPPRDVAQRGPMEFFIIER